MTELPPSVPPAAPSRPPPLWALGGCALLLLCGLIAGAAGAGAWFVNRGRTAAVEPAVEYILDASPRMGQASEGGTRLSVAQGVLAEVVRPADPSLRAGRRVFGTGVQPDAWPSRILSPTGRCPRPCRPAPRPGARVWPARWI